MKKIIVLLEILLMTYALTPGNLKVLSGELDGMKGELLFFAAGMGVILWLGRESNLKKNRWIWLLCAFLSFTTVKTDHIRECKNHGKNKAAPERLLLKQQLFQFPAGFCSADIRKMFYHILSQCDQMQIQQEIPAHH